MQAVNLSPSTLVRFSEQNPTKIKTTSREREATELFQKVTTKENAKTKKIFRAMTCTAALLIFGIPLGALIAKVGFGRSFSEPDPQSLVDQGKLFIEKNDTSNAIQCFRAALRQGHPEGIDRFMSLFNSTDLSDTNLMDLQIAANHNNTAALNQIVTFRSSNRSTFNSTASEFYLRKAANLTNSAEAKYQLAWMVADRTDVSRNQFCPLLQEAADQGHVEAQYDFAESSCLDSEEAKKYMIMAADQNHTMAMQQFVIRYNAAIYDVKGDDTFKKIETYARKIIDGNNDVKGNAHFVLGKSHEKNNEGQAAVEYYQQAANAGSEKAMLQLVQIYQSGKTQGIPKSPKKAFEWLLKTHENFKYNIHTPFKLGLMYENGEGVDQSTEKAIELYKKSGIAEARQKLFEIGQKYEKGEGVVQSTEKAIELYKASDTAEAMQKVLDIYKLGRGMQYSNQTVYEQIFSTFNKYLDVNRTLAFLTLTEAAKMYEADNDIDNAYKFYQWAAKDFSDEISRNAVAWLQQNILGSNNNIMRFPVRGESE